MGMNTTNKFYHHRRRRHRHVVVDIIIVGMFTICMRPQDNSGESLPSFIFMWVLEIELKSSDFHAKYLTHRAISLACAVLPFIHIQIFSQRRAQASFLQLLLYLSADGSASCVCITVTRMIKERWWLQGELWPCRHPRGPASDGLNLYSRVEGYLLSVKQKLFLE